MLNDYDLDVNGILSWLHGEAGLEALFPRKKEEANDAWSYSSVGIGR